MCRSYKACTYIHNIHIMHRKSQEPIPAAGQLYTSVPSSPYSNRNSSNYYGPSASPHMVHQHSNPLSYDPNNNYGNGYSSKEPVLLHHSSQYSNSRLAYHNYQPKQTTDAYRSNYYGYSYARESGTKSYSSKISDLNQRIAQDTRLFKLRNQKKNFDTRSSSSLQMKRSRMSAGQRRSSPYKGSQKGSQNNYEPFKYVTDSQSLSSSRASNQILSRPIITHSLNERKNQVKQSSSAIGVTQSYGQSGNYGSSPFEELPSFKKVRSNKFVQFQEFNATKPVLDNRNNQYNGTKIEKTMFPQRDQPDPIYFDQVKPRKQHNNVKQDQSIDEFLDMDFYKKQPLQQLKSRQSQKSRQFYEQQPVSPMTMHQGRPNPHLQNTFDKFREPLSPDNLQSGRFPGENPKVPKIWPKNQMNGVFSKGMSDWQGKIIPFVLVGIGIILVLFQAAR